MKRKLRAVSQGTAEKPEKGTTVKGKDLTFAELLLAALFATSLSLFATPASVQAQDRSDCLKLPVMQEGGSGMAGKARLCFNADGVRVRMSVHNLIPGRAYTVWFVYFDDPTKCITAPGTANPCGPPDLIKPVPSATDPNAAPAGVFGGWTARSRTKTVRPGSRPIFRTFTYRLVHTSIWGFLLMIRRVTTIRFAHVNF